MTRAPDNLPVDRLPLDGPPATTHYIWNDGLRQLVRFAVAAERPLLVVGEPGCGKTQLAKALATHWQGPLRQQTLHARSQASDLLFDVDAVARLADAQIMQALMKGAPDEKGSDLLALQHYANPGPLWWAWSPETAHKLIAERPMHRQGNQPDTDTASAPHGPTVVLIDEIDKAQPEVPEALLDVLDTGEFDIPWAPGRVMRDANAVAPVVILTTNDSRGLPAPLLRRCIVMDLDPAPQDRRQWLFDRARAHFSMAACPDDTVNAAISHVMKDDAAPELSKGYSSGLADVIYLLEAVVGLAGGDSKAQISLLQLFAPGVTTHKRKVSLA